MWEVRGPVGVARQDGERIERAIHRGEDVDKHIPGKGVVREV